MASEDMEQKTSNSGAVALADLHILLIDDEVLFLDTAENLLRSLGVTLITRASGTSEAFEKLTLTDRASERIVDCIICDFSMGFGNGLQVLQSIRTGNSRDGNSKRRSRHGRN
jgi:CheY-like chemotaxis protein